MTVLRGRRDDGVWSDTDRMMALALTAYEDTLCSGCGLPASKTRGDDNVGRWEVEHEVVCHGCEALESDRDSSSDKPAPGVKTTLVDAHAG